MPPEVKLSAKKFAAGLDRVISDAKFREALRKRPAEMLPELGIEISDKKRAEFIAKKVTRAGDRAAAMRQILELPDGPIVVAGVTVFVESEVEANIAAATVATVVTLAPVGGAQVEAFIEGLQKANIAKMRKAFSTKR